MSSVYATEPPTSGRVVLETTHGPLDMQLWCKECPTTTKHFLQLCMDGYYDHMIFHRIMPKVLIQTGILRKDPKSNDSSATNEPDEKAATELRVYRKTIQAEVALNRRKYELHSRLRFHHRGQVAMALTVNDNDDNTNDDDNNNNVNNNPSFSDRILDLQPQFFITLDEASHLDGNHIVFGTIQGPTFFNALRMANQTDVNEATHQPTIWDDAPRIQSIRILENPIHTTLVPTTIVPWKQLAKDKTSALESMATKKKKRKGKLNVNVLSFGDELDDVEDDGNDEHHSMARTAKKAKSNTVKESNSRVVKDSSASKDTSSTTTTTNTTTGTIGNGTSTDRTKAMPTTHTTTYGNGEVESSTRYQQQEQQQEDTKESKRGRSNENDNNGSIKKKESIIEQRRAKYTKGRKSKREREEETLDKLLAFQGKVRQKVLSTRNQGDSGQDPSSDGIGDSSLASRMARRAQALDPSKHNSNNKPDETVTYRGQILDDSDNDDGNADKSKDWLATRFKCRKHMDHQAAADSMDPMIGGDGRHMDDYEVIDDKQKQQSNHQQRIKGDHRHRHNQNNNNNRRHDRQRSDHRARHSMHHNHRGDNSIR